MGNHVRRLTGIPATPTQAGRVLFVGSGYGYAKKVLADLAEGKEVRDDRREFLEQFLGNALLMSTRYAWGAQGWGTPQLALLAFRNPELQTTLRQMMPFNRNEIPGLIRKHWHYRAAKRFRQPANASPSAWRQLHRERMYARFRLVDTLLPKPDLSQENACRLRDVWKKSGGLPPPLPENLSGPVQLRVQMGSSAILRH